MTLKNTLIALSLTALLTGCGGSTSKNTKPDVTAEPEQSEEVILSSESVFDPQSLSDVVRLIDAGEAFSPTDLAKIVNQIEAQSNRVSAEVEQLVANDDPADSYNVMTEMVNASWVKDLNHVIKFLRTAPLTELERVHFNTLLNANRRVNTTIAQIEINQLNGRKVGLRLEQ